MRVYVSGPMSDVPGLNRQAFAFAAFFLGSMGYRAVNPHDLSPARINGETDADYYDRCLEIDLRELGSCDAIFLLPGWESSNGARREFSRAMELGLVVMMGSGER
jgi:hypothetical protein